MTGMFVGDPPAQFVPRTVARQFQRGVPHAELQLIDGAGHLSPIERPEPVNDTVRTLCRAHPPRG